MWGGNVGESQAMSTCKMCHAPIFAQVAGGINEFCSGLCETYWRDAQGPSIAYEFDALDKELMAHALGVLWDAPEGWPEWKKMEEVRASA